jgi:hypothetical protein
MSWDDVEDILFDGTIEQIETVKCPECGGRLKMSYSPKARSLEVHCKDCYTVLRSNGAEKTPYFALISV